jgi:hypothetical protein
VNDDDAAFDRLATWLAAGAPGVKTYAAAAGLVILAGWQFYAGNAPGAVQSVLAALAAAGIRHAIDREPFQPGG